MTVYERRFESLSNLMCPTNGILGFSFKAIVEEIELTECVVVLTLMKTVRLIKDGWKEEEINDKCRGLVQIELRNLDVLINEYVWEHLNTGHWKSVSPVWRKLYTFATLLKVILLLLEKDDLKDVIKQCDLGLLMGQPVLNNVLSSLAEEIGCSLRKKCSVSPGEASGVHSQMEMDIRELPNQSIESRFSIEFVDRPSLMKFRGIMQRETPVVITNSVHHWPARQKWSVDYIVNVAGFRTCPVEIGAKYTSEDWTQKLMTIEEFVQNFMNQTTTSNNGSKDFGYIAQHNLFDQIPVLAKDICIPEYCSLGSKTNVDINGWFGPANTVSPTHYDPKHNLLVQVFGTKIIRLYPPSESEFLCPFASDSLLFNTSQLDIEDPELLVKKPDLRAAKYCEFILEPGMVLYMPPKWWHFIKSLTPSFSVSFWFE